MLWPRHSANIAECRYYHTRWKATFKKTKYCFKNVCRVSACAALGILLSFTESSTRRQGILKTKKIFKKKLVAECVAVWHSAKSPLTAGLALWPFLFAESQTAHGKNFAECPINGTRQSWLCRYCLWRVLFAECYTRRTICRVFSVFCRVFRALGKLKESGSVYRPLRAPLAVTSSMGWTRDHLGHVRIGQMSVVSDALGDAMCHW